MQKKFLYIGIPISLLLIVACYTVLKHPQVTTDEYTYQEVTPRSNCNACHGDCYHHPYSSFYPYYSSHLFDWRYYYGYPWWLDDEYFIEDNVVDERAHKRRGFDRRRGLEPNQPYSPASKKAAEAPSLQKRGEDERKEERSLQSKEARRKAERRREIKSGKDASPPARPGVKEPRRNRKKDSPDPAQTKEKKRQ